MRLFIAHIALLIIPIAIYGADADTTKYHVTRTWTLSKDYTTEINIPLDTAFSLFQRHRITDKYSDFNAYPGNYGLPLYQINFFDREWNPDKFLYYYYLPFMYTPSNPLYVNTQVPFTELVWTFGGARSNSEQTFRVRHSQNINPKLNFGFIYDIVYCLGQYEYQTAIDKNFLLHSSYNGNNYTAYFSAGINNHRSSENGGIASLDYLKEYTPENVPVNLNDLNKALSTLKNRYIMLVQRYSPGAVKDSVTGETVRSGPVTFSHIGTYEWNKRMYSDSYPTSDFYNNIYIDDTGTKDSLYQGILSNTLRMDVAAGRAKKFKFGAGAGVRSEIRHFSQVVAGDSLTRPDILLRNKSSLVLTGRIFNNIGDKFGWWATGEFWFQGYRAGDFVFNGRIFKDFSTKKGPITWDATSTVASYTPSYWFNSWESNNFSWQLDALKEFRIVVGSSLSYPGIHLNLKFNYAIIDNFIYMGSNATPAQHTGGLSIAALTVKKEFVVWKLHWDNTLLLQQSSNNDVLSLPLAAGRSSLFIEHLFRFKSTGGELNMQIGGEVFIHTPYDAMKYMPATGRYFSQSASETGGYPFVNIFLNLKLKRTRFFLMFDHVNSGFTGYDYFLIPDYPMSVRMLRYGLAWTFYN